MAALLKQLNPAISQYRDRRFQGTQEGFEEALRTSACIYVGNLSFYTTEDQIYEVGRGCLAAHTAAATVPAPAPPASELTAAALLQVFSKVGDIKRIIMGLDKKQKTPCGFCFVVYYTREDAEDCVKYLSGTSLDDRPIRADFDWGFVEGRQYGRGKSGGQVGRLPA